MSRHDFTRRRFLAVSAGVAAAAAVVPRCVLGAGRQPPSETVTGALIGVGPRGLGTWTSMGLSKPRMLAVCDVDDRHIEKGLKSPHASPDTKGYKDFRQVMDRKDIDVICIATPPHWHALMCLAAARAGKDILCEKPMTKFIAEGRAVADACKKHKVIFQICTFGRFGRSRTTHKLYASGLVKESGALVRANVPLRVGQTDLLEGTPVPPELDYDMWLGPAPFKPYHPARVHYSNRFYWDYEGGDLTNFGHHRIDPFTYEYAKDDTGPVEIEPYGRWPAHPDAVGPWGWVELKYADGVRLVIETGKWGKPYDRPAGKTPALSAEDQKKLDAMPDPEPLVRFAEAIRTRQQAGGNAEAAHRGVTALHLANIALRVGRKLRWDPVAEQIVGDEEANRFVNIAMRAPWRL
jgi:myo-inositol 2-dehydrogenase / D-chiro-inositol 1-dehydrogenase